MIYCIYQIYNKQEVLMKRIFAAVLAAVMLLTSCTATPPEETSPADAAVEMGYLTGIYSTAAEAVADSVCTPILPIDPASPLTGYRYASAPGSPQIRIVTCIDGEETTVTAEAAIRPSVIAMTENGVFTIECPYNPEAILLRQYAFTGELLREADITSYAPSSDRKFADYPGSVSRSARYLPILETDSGYLLTWGNFTLTLDGEFGNPVSREFSSDIINLFRDDVTGSVWVYYRNEGDKLENTENGTILSLPDVPEADRRSVIGIHDGIVYCMDRKSVHSYNSAAEMTAESAEELMSYENSLLLLTPYSAVPVFTGDEVHLSLITMDEAIFQFPLLYCIPVEDIPLNEITVLELVTAGRNPDLQKTVYAFNASQYECRIILNDYSRFNTDDDINAGLDRLRLDLETGILAPDLIFTDARTYHNMITSSPDLFMDLYTLDYSEAEYSPDDLWTAVRHAGEVDGKLYAILPEYSVSILAGLKTHTGDITGWNLEEFLDWAENLPKGEYVMDEYGRDTYAKPFGYGLQWLHFYEQGTFDDPLYTRYLNFISNLPAKGPKIQQKRSTIIDPDDLLEDFYDISNEPYDGGGENMYLSGTIKLLDSDFSGVGALIKMMDKLGADSAAEINFMGYPTDRGRGVELKCYKDCIYSILAKCKNPEMAWKFAEYLLEQNAQPAVEGHGLLKVPQSPYATAIPSLRQPAVDYLKSLEGMDVFYNYLQEYMITDPAEIETLLQKRNPGKLYTIDSAMTEFITDLLDSELLTLADNMTLGLIGIMNGEERSMLKGEQNVQTTAEAVASRTAIYIAEKN